MAEVLTIGAEVTAPQAGSLRISETLNGRNTLTCDVVSMDGTYRPAGLDGVTYERDSVLWFGGFIEDPQESGHKTVSKANIATRINVVDYNALPDRRHIEVTLPAGTLKAGLTILTTYLAGYGVTLSGSQVDGPTLEALPFERQSLTQILNRLSLITGYVWSISYAKVLSMSAPGATAAPFNLTSASRNIVGDIKVDTSLKNYANRVIVRFSEDARPAYAFLSTTANFTNGETVTVASRTYTFQDTLTDVNGNVHIGADATESLSNLIAAINVGAGAGTAYATTTTVHSLVTAALQSASMMRVIALTAGASGNTQGVSDTAASATWITEGGGAVSTLQFGADEALVNFVTAENVAEQEGGANLVERTFSHPEVRLASVAQAYADGYLVRHLQKPKTVSYSCRTLGLHPNQVQTINISARSLSGNFLITAVEYVSIGTILRCHVTAVSETDAGLVVPPDNRDFFRGFTGSASGGAVGSISVGGAGTTGMYANLGGSRSTSPTTLTGAWRTMSAAIPLAPASTGYVTQWHVEARTRNAGVSFKVRLYAPATDTVAGETVVLTPGNDIDNPEIVAIPVSILASTRYLTQVIADDSPDEGEDAYVVSTLCSL